MVENRGQYATFITILAAGTVLTVSSLLVLQFEAARPTPTSRPEATPSMTVTSNT